MSVMLGTKWDEFRLVRLMGMGHVSNSGDSILEFYRKRVTFLTLAFKRESQILRV